MVAKGENHSNFWCIVKVFYYLVNTRAVLKLKGDCLILRAEATGTWNPPDVCSRN